ncbi:MAG: 50S ribosomal protein L15 [Firmicutes bacterium]|nr:50S ribosomal protein L15 [Bacillota bacterium]
MKPHELQPAPNSKKTVKRLGRGIGSGHGKTCCKGHKGQWARSGGGVRIGFEGGQKPLARRIPKTGFTNNWSKVYSIVNLADLEKFEDGETVSAQTLLEKGVLSKIEQYGVKVLAGGDIAKKLTVRAAKFSGAAKEKLEKAGCTVEVLGDAP